MPASLALLLRELELDRPTVVTLARLESLRARCGVAPEAAEIARRLRSLGWLLPLRVRGAWEFAPADRGGPVRGEDPFIEVRALQATRPDIQVTVGYESAAFLRGYSLRRPDTETVILAEGTPVVRALDEFHRIVLSLPNAAASECDGLPILNGSGLVAAVAVRPDGVREWPWLASWATTAAAEASATTLGLLLRARSASAWSRAAYLLSLAGNVDGARELMTSRPPGRGPFYLGPHRTGGSYHAPTEVIDTAGLARIADPGR